MIRTMKEWLTSDLLFHGALTRQERLWNATRLRIRVSRYYAEGGGLEVLRVLHPRFAFSYTEWMFHADVYAVRPLHLALRAWHWWAMHRWDLERWGLLNGLFQQGAENETLHTGRWRWPGDLPLGGRRRAPFEWSREKQLQHHPTLWADNPPGGGLCS